MGNLSRVISHPDDGQHLKNRQKGLQYANFTLKDEICQILARIYTTDKIS